MEKRDVMTHRQGDCLHIASAIVRFEHGLGMALDGLVVQLKANTRIFTSTTDELGRLPALLLDAQANLHLADSGWIIARPYPVTIEVRAQRPSGSWKRIGSFELREGDRKEVVISAGNAVTSMPLARIGAK
ncbi:hypothetical protein [Cupriavidus cauae]|uniref:Uncharacterized protein n=1 Tax=Cupriavidus cauae TaxID=2608999 RepID=A0A5M8AN31_9BURK|nr:hypothetical protein [Cupriavidus cauae]KAA6125208.1 hypothetical protein F1599_10435 [Cupriavidus cauae]